LLRQVVTYACCLALAKAGKSNAARMAIIAMTTSSSIRVKPPVLVRLSFVFTSFSFVSF